MLWWHKHPIYDQNVDLDDSIKAKTLFKCFAQGPLQSFHCQDKYFVSFVLTFSSSPEDNQVQRTRVLQLGKRSTMKFSSVKQKQNIFQHTAPPWPPDCHYCHFFSFRYLFYNILFFINIKDTKSYICLYALLKTY